MCSKEMMGVRFHALTMDETLQAIRERLEQGAFTQHGVINVAKLVAMQQDADLRDSVNACDIVNIDGMGVVWGARLLNIAVPERVTGIDLFHQLLEMSEKFSYPVYFLGATQEVVEITVKKIIEQHPCLNIAGYHNGFFWDNEELVVNQIRDSGARLLFVAITSPKKENFINRWKDNLGVGFAMGVGGTFDVVAGKVQRAPLWMQQCGLEWFYRFLQEPGRMWKRYLVTNIIFAWYLIKKKLSIP